MGYECSRNAIRDYVDKYYKTEYKDLKGALIQCPSLNVQSNTIFIKEPRLYTLIFRFKLESEKVFQNWVFSEVLPSIRKYGHYRMFNNPNTLTFKIEDEYDLHTKVVQFIRRFYPEILMTAGLGENQDTKEKRIKSFKEIYERTT